MKILTELKINFFPDGMLRKFTGLTYKGFKSPLVCHRSYFIFHFIDNDWIYSVGDMNVVPAQFDK